MLFRKLILILLFVSTAALSSGDVCLFDQNSNGLFSGADEIRECEVGYNFAGGQVDYCPTGNVPCNIVSGVPVCPTDPSYACSQSSSTEPFTCKSTPPRDPIPSDLSLQYDLNDDAYIIQSPDRESCVHPIVESCTTSTSGQCYPEQYIAIAGITIAAYCTQPDSCKTTDTWNMVTQSYDSVTVCTPPPPCYTTFVGGVITHTCPSAPACSTAPLGNETCPSNPSKTCTAPTKGDPNKACSVTPDIIPPDCRIEYDQSSEAHIVCDTRTATCLLDGGKYNCPFNTSTSACTRPDSSSPYTCHVEEETCKSTAGVTTVNPDTFTPFPQTTNNEDIQGDGTCAGEVKIFNGEPFSCHTAGIRVRWDNCCTNGNHIIDDAVDNYLDGAVSMAEMVTELFGSGGLSDAVNKLLTLTPAYIGAEAVAQIGNYLLSPCADDSLTASMIATGRCVTVGTRCVESLFGQCLQEKQIECCFASKLARIINEQARPQLGLNFGTTSVPDCKGLSPEEFQSIDFSQIDLSEYISDITVKSQSAIDSEIGASVSDDLIRITNGG